MFVLFWLDILNNNIVELQVSSFGVSEAGTGKLEQRYRLRKYSKAFSSKKLLIFLLSAAESGLCFQNDGA